MSSPAPTRPDTNGEVSPHARGDAATPRRRAHDTLNETLRTVLYVLGIAVLLLVLIGYFRVSAALSNFGDTLSDITNTSTPTSAPLPGGDLGGSTAPIDPGTPPPGSGLGPWGDGTDCQYDTNDQPVCEGPSADRAEAELRDTEAGLAGEGEANAGD